jgi:hypothetical protein
MQLNRLPLFERLSGARSVLIAGAGGGFDVYTGIPLFLALRGQGVEVHLASLSFAWLDGTDAEAVTEVCRAVTATTASDDNYFPERALAEWLLGRGIEQPVYAFDKTGVLPLTEAYEALVARHNLDAVVLVDGGTDSLMRGDEDGLGTPHEDMLSVAAVSQLSLPCKLLVCLGFGVDAYHGVCHAHFLEGVAELDRAGGYLGAFSLQRGTPEVDAYLEAVAYANAQIHTRPSIVNASIASAIVGEYGDVHRTSRTHGSKLWINPLMALYWAFELDAVATRVRYMHGLLQTRDFGAVVRFIEGFHKGVENKRPWTSIPV